MQSDYTAWLLLNLLGEYNILVGIHEPYFTVFRIRNY